MSWRIPLVDLASEYAEVGSAVEEAVLRVLRSGHYVLGPETAAFEAELACKAHESVRLNLGVGSERTHRLQPDFVGMVDDVTCAQLQLPRQLVETVEQVRNHLFLRLWQDVLDHFELRRDV